MFAYTIRSHRMSKNVRISIRPDGTVVVTKPSRVPVKFAEAFVESKKEWIIEKLHTITPRVVHTKKEIEELKKKALHIAEDKVQYFNRFYNFSYKNISIKNQKTRWGSCSKQGNLNFNYKIALLPEKLADYLVVHELCHLGQFNHSQKFWNLVGEVLPEYKKLRKELKDIKM